MRTLAFVFLLLTAPFLHVTVSAQNALDEAKAHYEAAAYEEALATLTRITDAEMPVSRVEVEQYRALCLIALGNMADAERAIVALVAADPIYVPSANVASPRVLSVVADIRKKELPTVARRLLDAGRVAYQGNDLDAARRHFDLLLQLLADPAMAERPEKEDLLPLAHGFAALTAAALAPPSTPASSANETDSARATGTSAQLAAPAAESFYVPPVVIQQSLPEWEPPSASIARLEYSGLLRVRIGIDGTVTAADIERPSYPSYDGRLLQVARTWLYKPATRNGVPVESEKVIVIQLRPVQ
jgi:tetratricopeptide (TPR) repeat protein